MANRIVIKRQVKPGKLTEALTLLKKLRTDAMNQSGYISSETLVNHYDDHRLLVVSTWQAVDDWILWQESENRIAIASELEPLMAKPVTFEVYDIGAPRNA